MTEQSPETEVKEERKEDKKESELLDDAKDEPKDEPEEDKEGEDKPKSEMTNVKSLRERALGGENEKWGDDGDKKANQKKMMRWLLVVVLGYFAFEYVWDYMFE